MRRALTVFLLACAATITAEPSSQTSIQVQAENFTPFTGRITGKSVRLRAQPNLDGKVIRELDKGELVLTKGLEGGFYSIALPSDIKAYVFRTFVLDGTIEGTNVNVRLAPSLEGPVIAQLNTGDKVSGKVSEENSKWLEITPPESASLYIASDYLERAGDADYLVKMEQEKSELHKLFQEAVYASQSELRKPFNEVDFPALESTFKQLIARSEKYTNLNNQAKEALELIRDSFLQKKIAFLEEKVGSSQITAKAPEAKELEKSRVHYTEQAFTSKAPTANAIAATEKMSVWEPVEEGYFSRYLSADYNTISDFYLEEKGTANRIHGILEVYSKPIKNKPGDYILRDRESNMPIGYLYSTKINLDDYVGREISLKAAPRPNRHFAFPAYFVHSVE